MIITIVIVFFTGFIIIGLLESCPEVLVIKELIPVANLLQIKEYLSLDTILTSIMIALFP